MDTDRLDALFERHLDNALTAEEQADLAALLADPEAQRRWRELASLEGKLLEEGMARGKVDERFRKPVRRLSLHRFRTGGSRAPLAWVAVALVAFAGIVLAALTNRNGRPGEPAKVTAVEIPRAPEPEPAPSPEPSPPSKTAPKPVPENPPPPPERKEPERFVPPPQPPSPEPPRKEPPRETVVVLAHLEQMKGNVAVRGSSGRAPARAAQALVAGQGLVTSGRGSLAVILFPDGTRVEVGPDTEIAELADADGKRIVLGRGFVEADVTPQPPGRPLVLATPNAEARVLGTTLRLFAEQDMTRLEVEKGRVRLQRLADQRSVEVLAGHFAVAGTGVDLTARAIPARPAVVSFTLINADTEQPVAGFDPIKEGAVINLSKLPTRNLNVRANVMPRKVGSVRFSLNGAEIQRIENGTTGAVYSLAGDLYGKYNAWVPAAGSHTVTATPYPEPDAKGPPGAPLSVTFRVVAK